ncbi:mucoidy inhibitor MuiA family protein [Roseicyclus sp.]|uniref:DUF4139 domain-containing protein n=1 Tax=Roseicyclus sp. TaxID=1914329 RepID=UPI003FA0E50D
MRDFGDPSSMEVTAPEGVVVLPPQSVDRIAIPEGALDTATEAAARDAVERAEFALETLRDTLARRDATIAGLETQLAYLQSLSRGGPEGAAMPSDPARLAEILAALGTETARVGTELQAAREDRRAFEEALEDRVREVAEARQALADLNPFGTEAQGIAIEIEVPEATRGEVVISYMNWDTSWSPTYALRLDTEAGALAVERSILFSYRGAATWRDVDTRFSTAIPNRQRVPSQVFPDPARIAPPAPEPAPRVASEMAVGDMMPAPAIVAEAAVMVTDGLSVVYEYATPVTVGPLGEITLPFDDLALDVALENRAVPRRDATAFLVATGRNDTGEAILPGEARFFRDGDLVGTDFLPMIPAGAEVEMAFGALDHLVLSWQDLSRDEGDRGVFVSQNEQRRRIAFGIENTSTETEEVRLLYAVPFAEQEDLDVSVTFSRAPDMRDVDDMRGVSAWTLSVPPATEERIEMTVEMTWPEDMILTWWP